MWVWYQNRGQQLIFLLLREYNVWFGKRDREWSISNKNKY